MLRDDIARIVYEGYTGMPWPDEDEHLNNAARKHADEIMELPEIKQSELMREKIIKKITIGLGQYVDNKTNWIGDDAKRILREVLAILQGGRP